MCHFSGKRDNFDFFDRNLPKNVSWPRIFKNLSLNSESQPPRYHMYHFSVKTDNFEFFGLNLGKFPNYLGSYNVEGTAVR